MAEIDKIKTKVFNLLNKTVENGCSEAEAMAAAKMAGKLMDHYQLQMSDIQIRDEKCIQYKIDTGAVNRQAIDGVVVSLARYCDVKIWFSKGQHVKRYRDINGEVYKDKQGRAKPKVETYTSKYGLFGLKCDVELFEYLYTVIVNAMETELKNFQESEDYLRPGEELPRGWKTSATKSFQSGMASTISMRLGEMKRERKREMETTGRDLVLLKKEMIEEEFKSTGIRLFNNYNRRTGGQNYRARKAGHAAGKKVNLNGGIHGSAAVGALE